jgi:hypothetical protein
MIMSNGQTLLFVFSEYGPKNDYKDDATKAHDKQDFRGYQSRGMHF